MKTWFKVPEHLPEDCVMDFLTIGKWYNCIDLECNGSKFVADNGLMYHMDFSGSSLLGGYSVERKEFPEGFSPNEVDQAIFSQHLNDIPEEPSDYNFAQSLKESLSEAVEIVKSKGIVDNVNSPSHYNTGGSIECIDYIKDFLNEEEYIGYLRGNIAKYLHRWRYKNGLEDLEKAKVYLGWLIDAVGEPE